MTVDEIKEYFIKMHKNSFVSDEAESDAFYEVVFADTTLILRHLIINKEVIKKDITINDVQIDEFEDHYFYLHTKDLGQVVLDNI